MKRRPPRLGQHFLTGLWAAQKLAQAIGVRTGETILEIGPGRGALTRELLATDAPVVAIEKDELLVEALNITFARKIQDAQLTLLTSDIRDIDPLRLHLNRYVVAANIPYYITGEIIRQFLTAGVQPRAMALLVQSEVAKRIVARDGKESILSISVKAYGTPRIIAKVARGNFSPPPSVDSAILLIENISRDFFRTLTERSFFGAVRAGFASKRKFLANNLSEAFGRVRASRALRAASVAPKARAEDVPLEQWKLLARALESSSA